MFIIDVHQVRALDLWDFSSLDPSFLIYKSCLAVFFCYLCQIFSYFSKKNHFQTNYLIKLRDILLLNFPLILKRFYGGFCIALEYFLKFYAILMFFNFWVNLWHFMVFSSICLISIVLYCLLVALSDILLKLYNFDYFLMFCIN